MSVLRCAATILVTALWCGAAAAQPLKAVTVASGLANPWSLAFLPDGRMLVTEKAGRLRVVNGSTVSSPVSGVPEVDSTGQGGLFDVLVAPDFASSRRIWLSYAEPGSGSEAGRNGLAVGTGVLNPAHTAVEQWQVIFRQSPKVASRGHFGGRLVWQGSGNLWVTLGDRQSASERGKAQDLAVGHGKVMRIVAATGAPAAGNPFVAPHADRGAQPAIWSYGHRNIQGAAVHPASGELWVAEHGPQGGDELNRVQPGRNYGWPLVSHGCEYGSPVGNCKLVGGASGGEGFEPPLSVWLPTSVAPSGLIFYSGKRFPEWRGQLFMGALAGQALWRIELKGDVVAGREALLTELGERIRDVRQSPDGELYVLTDSRNGRVVRVER
ncbi:MAG TPA: PQQ-dependent sugar dehydrogenase [Rubrivivax sp.]|nr:PQQ-dependent sugar dehydrogenase [Rubrivivax sp.]